MNKADAHFERVLDELGVSDRMKEYMRKRRLATINRYVDKDFAIVADLAGGNKTSIVVI